MEYIIWGIIIAAVLFVAIKKFKDIKRGKFCSCGCEDCKNKCREFTDDKERV